MSTKNNHPPSGPGVWIGIVVLFALGLWPVAIGLLIWQIINLNKSKGQATRKRHPYDIQREWEQSARDTASGRSAADQVWQAAESAVTRAGEEIRKATAAQKTAHAKKTAAKGRPASGKRLKFPSGHGLIVVGAIVAGIFLIATLGVSLTFAESLLFGYFFADELIGVIVCALFLLAGLTMIGAGVARNRKGKRWCHYHNLIGTRTSVPITALARAAGVPRGKVVADLQDMLARNLLPPGYLDLSRDLLVFSVDGIPDEEPVQAQPAPGPEQDDDAILRQIRAVNDAIPDPVMSEKIDRIGAITAKILDYQRRNPGKDSQLRSFLNYYLPTTLKILNAYAQLDAQGVEGENISAAKARIEGMMDKVVEGFENQLDKLFADSAMDISSDVAVLEQMLEKDGLSGQNQGMTL